ncbi:hypothetical protein Taro_024844 [Colocasia esculenta]|uniref:Uncharacterized protein n=1 Tax=Colocasia esculenta TaxID=4460 RepID=A0A843VAI4_COLES|nr:hypothetical protein [Colocasia esculenta]
MGARGGFGVNREIVGGSSVFGGLKAEELGVNIVCRQAHQLGCKRPDPLPSTSCKRQSMLPPTGYKQECLIMFPTEPVTNKDHPYPPPPQVRARRTFHDRRPVQSRAVAVQGRYLQLCSSSSSSLYLGVRESRRFLTRLLVRSRIVAFLDLVEVERQLDLSSVAARLRGSLVLFVHVCGWCREPVLVTHVRRALL